MANREQGDLGNLPGGSKMLSQLASSPDAQALAALLKKGHDDGQLEQMAQNAAKGDMESLKAIMQTITQSPEGSELLRRLSDSFRKN